MPDYIKQPDPISLKVYSDAGLTNLIIDDPNSVVVDLSELMPGEFEGLKFEPSNEFASAKRVAYTLHVKPQHQL